MEEFIITDIPPESSNRPAVLPRVMETKIYEIFGHVSAYIGSLV
jgi:hypothetical protein